MGFFDSLVSAGRSALKSASDAMDKKIVDSWVKASNLDRPRLSQIIHNSIEVWEKDRIFKLNFLLALAAYHQYGSGSINMPEELKDNVVRRARSFSTKFELSDDYEEIKLVKAFQSLVKIYQ